jgi:hypothetical protein
VFRELLQNSDDASSSAVEIHFETEAYVKRHGAGGAAESINEAAKLEKLPDLKTAVVRSQV